MEDAELPPPLQLPPPPPPRSPPLPRLSIYSTGAVVDSAWSAFDIMLGAGIVIFQAQTHKIVVVHNTKKDCWFFPRGKKDKGESLEETALREGYEESGYKASFLPLCNPSRQPASPKSHNEGASSTDLNVEPIFLTLTAWQPQTRNGKQYDQGGEYLITWYAGGIAEDADKDDNTGMYYERHYKSHLMSYDEAMQHIGSSSEKRVLRFAWSLYVRTVLNEPAPDLT